MEPNDTAWEPTTRQQALIDRMASFPYPKLAHAARALKFSESTVKKWSMQPGFKAALTAAYAAAQHDTKAELERRVHALSDASIVALSAALTSEDDGVRLRAAQLVLDRVLGKPKERHEVTGTDGAAITHEHVLDVRGLSDAELALLERIALRTPDSGTR